MNFAEIVAGQRQRWRLVKKIGEGDAGEVYRVESLLEHREAILKRPRRDAFATDVIRQAGQIKSEGQILKALANLPASSQEVEIRLPLLLDQSAPGTEFGESQFIVVEQAPGFNLAMIARLALFGQMDDAASPVQSMPETHRFLDRVAARKKFPPHVLLSCLLGLVELLENIHFFEVHSDHGLHAGVIWNDVKPEHIYWDPVEQRVTVIDWGNGQFLEQDGGSVDRGSSRLDDYQQYLTAMGAFISDSCPELLESLAWPKDITAGNAFSDGILPLKERLLAQYAQSQAGVARCSRKAGDLAGVTQPDLAHLLELRHAQEELLDYGLIPDFNAAGGMHARLAARLAANQDLAGFREVCSNAFVLPAADDSPVTQKWAILDEIAAQGETSTQIAGFSKVLAAAVRDDWATAVWELLSLVGDNHLPAYWDDLVERIRKLHLQVSQDLLAPQVAVSRLYYTLQANTTRFGNLKARQDQTSPDEGMLAIDGLVRRLEIAMRKWKEAEPDPPDAGVAYSDIDTLLEEIEQIIPGTWQSLEKSLGQARAQARIVLDAWRSRDFEVARRGLRQLLLWDPSRRRVLLADRALQAAPRWLLRVRQGASPGEPFTDFLTQAGLAGRELRNQIGSAGWLDAILEALKSLRNGGRPADIIMQRPEILNDLPWLSEHRTRETLSLPRSQPLGLERLADPPAVSHALHGVIDGVLGIGKDIALGEALDTWIPEARGSSARVFSGKLRNRKSPLAIKIMRPDKTGYALPLFHGEAQVLSLLHDASGITPLVECGFLKLHDGITLPSEERGAHTDGVEGVLARYSPEQIPNFLMALERRVDEGWLPYLALELRRQENNLMKYCDAGHTHGQFLPLRECLILAIQICDILQVAHDRNIVYRDHKLLHYYWDPQTQGVAMIDWNIARHNPQGLSPAERKADIVQFGARALHHIFTGRAAPGALPLGPNSAEEIEQASQSYPVQWTYDDERLPNQLKDILAQSMSGGYAAVRDLRQDLVSLYQMLPEPDAVHA